MNETTTTERFDLPASQLQAGDVTRGSNQTITFVGLRGAYGTPTGKVRIDTVRKNGTRATHYWGANTIIDVMREVG